MDTLRVVVWGPGWFGRKWLAEVQRSPDCELAGVISRAPERGAELAEELGVESIAVFADPAEAREAGADVVIIALPQMLHRDAAIEALAADLHVLIEKPLAMDLEEARAIRTAAATRPDLTVMVTQNFRWRPHAITLRKAVRDGAIGRLSHVGLACRQAIKRSTAEGWREGMADPYLADFAIHHFDLLRFVTGLEVEEAYAVSFRPPGSWFDGKSAAVAVLKMSGGVSVSYQGTMVTPSAPTPQEGTLTLIGEEGVLQLDGKYQVILAGVGDPVPLSQPVIPDGELAHGLRALVECIRFKTKPETSVDDNFKSFAALMAVMESSASGRPVKVVPS
jgi:predicted dehydrogenase